MKSLSYKAVILTERNMLNWMQTNQDPTKKLQDFITPGVLLLLVQNEQRLQRPNSEFLNEASIRTVKPETLLDMIARYLRPMTVAEYYEAVWNSIPEPKSTTKDWTFGFEGYDKELHAAISKCVEQAKSLHTLINLGALADETVLWPKAEWGSKTKPGLLRVYSKALGKYEEYFVERITEADLKTMKSVQEFFDAVIKHNHELANYAKDLVTKTALFYKAPSLEDSFQLARSGARDRHTQSSFLAGKVYNQTQSGTPLSHARGEHDARGRRPDHHENSNTGHKGRPYDRMHSLVQDIASPDDSARMSQVHPMPGMVDHSDSGEEDVEYEQTLYELIGTPAGKHLFQGKVSPRPSASTLPCFAQARGEEHDAKTCPYSHDPTVYKDAMRKRVEDVLNTLGKAWLTQTIDRLETRPSGPETKYVPKQPRYADAPVRVVPNPNHRDLSQISFPPDLPGLEDASADRWASLSDKKEES